MSDELQQAKGWRDHVNFWREHKRKGLARLDDPPPPPDPVVNILGFRMPRWEWNANEWWRKALIVCIVTAGWIAILGLIYAARVLHGIWMNSGSA